MLCYLILCSLIPMPCYLFPASVPCLCSRQISAQHKEAVQDLEKEKARVANLEGDLRAERAKSERLGKQVRIEAPLSWQLSAQHKEPLQDLEKEKARVANLEHDLRAERAKSEWLGKQVRIEAR
ncbi:unnamed protein product [Closterium sp. NIES-54]